AMGMVPMASSTGINALYQGMASGCRQVMVLEGQISRMKHHIQLNQEETRIAWINSGTEHTSKFSPSNSINNSGILLESTQKMLIMKASKILSISPEEIYPDGELSEYGFDSFALTEFSNLLNDEYDLGITPPIFFEHSNLGQFAKYLIQAYPVLFAEKFGIQENKSTETSENKSSWSRFTKPRQPEKNREKEDIGLRHPFEPVAIIGMSGSFPMAPTLEEFWNNLLQGKDCIEEIPTSRWDWQKYYGDPLSQNNKTNIKWGGFIKDAQEFDPLFFKISPKEAELMDPHQRLLMTYAWKAIEDAGYSAQSLSGSNTGIFVGTAESGYGVMILKAKLPIEGFTSTGQVSSVGPNRMSYFLNIHGPSEPIETACSSSLVAIHRALSALQNNTCEMAIAGGVNILVKPEFQISFNKAGMLCEDGRCKTFSDRANGYVRGEGVGMILLKKLSKAEQDKDHIYGILRGSAENHGGRANSLTAPNPKAQAELLKMVYTTAGIDPRTMTYIEAHGTGTELGDPIEIDALKTAFEELYQAAGASKAVTSHCGLGAVKTNIGHLELAAGIAGVIKVLLQLKHKTLVKTLHCNTLNPYIKLENSPFYILRETKPWDPLLDIQGNPIPLRAGISSFGFGGTNAHVVIEEYISKNDATAQIEINTDNPAMIILSAKNEYQLLKKAEQLVSGIEKNHYSDKDLADIAFTLQVGRDAMDFRMGLIAQSIRDLKDKLSEFIQGKEYIPGLYQGKVKTHKDILAVFSTDSDIEEAIETWVEKKKYAKLLDLWVRGMTINWDKFYNHIKPTRISLPTYPFARERYWIPEAKSAASNALPSGNYQLHPLVHENISNLSAQCFKSTFTGTEFYLSDHVIQDRHILPGVAHLEMARAAVELSSAVKDGPAGIMLHNIVWARPLVVQNQPVQARIRLIPKENTRIAYEIYSQTRETDFLLHSQGTTTQLPVEKALTLDLMELENQCSQTKVSSTQVYQAFHVMGIDYGPSHQGIQALHIGSNQVLAKLCLPDSAMDTLDQYVLHPGLMDSALQASIGFMPDILTLENLKDKKPLLPFALESLEIYGPCKKNMWVFIRYSKTGTLTNHIQKLDMDLCDDQGKISCRMTGFTSRVLELPINQPTPGQNSFSDSIETMMWTPSWKEKRMPQDVLPPEYLQYLIICCELGTHLPQAVEAGVKDSKYRVLQSEEKSIAKRFQIYAVKIFEAIQEIIRQRPRGKVLIQVVIPEKEKQQPFMGLSGLLKTACLENRKISCQLICIDPDEDGQTIREKLKDNACLPNDQVIRYKNKKRLVAAWSEIKPVKEASRPWKDHGLYLITGGSGSLGLVFAQKIIQQAKGTRIILTGRTPLTRESESRISALNSSNTRVIFKQLDMTQEQDVNHLMSNIRQEHGDLNGVIHAAGVIHDNFILKKSRQEFIRVLDPKVTGLVHLDNATKDIELDCFILFSSVAGALGNPGQADYAAANAFMDAYAGYRNDLVERKKRHGQTLSMNWPLWKEGGMTVDPATEQMMFTAMGMVPMASSTGINALYQGMASGCRQVMVLEGQKNRINDFMFKPESARDPYQSFHQKKTDLAHREIESQLILDNTISYFKTLISSVIKLPVQRIEADAPLEKYGINSILILQLTTQLEKTFGPLSKTLFFEYQTIGELTGYFIESHLETLISLFRDRNETLSQPANVNSSKVNIEPLPVIDSVRSRFSRPVDNFIERDDDEKVAIIGLAGQYPKARNIQEFWTNLCQGKDCITQIPAGRWDHSLYFNEDKEKPGKTYSKWGGFLDDVDKFDALFFNITPKEAELIDPQERLFLQCVHDVFEDAGYNRAAIKECSRSGLEGDVGVFAGVMYEEYQLWGVQEQLKGKPIAISGHPSSIANRVSYTFNLHGPCMAVDTMCSSSLTAIHLACQSLYQRECELAIAGGVIVSIHPNKYLSLGQGRFISSKGRCESFGTGGDGYVPGEGVGAVLLKPLSKAIRDKDHIYGVIIGTAINHGGKTNGYSVPNPKAQTNVIGHAIKKAGITARAISYLEAHGTGTFLGDPIEITGLVNAYKKDTLDTQFCSIGSVKSNIGHAESAAGIAGLTKVLLQLKYKQIVPSLHSKVLNPNIDFSKTPFVVQQELTKWEKSKEKSIPVQGQKSRIAGISSFGAGGSNAHVLIKEFSSEDKEKSLGFDPDHQPLIMVLSAETHEQLRQRAERMLDFIRGSDFSESRLRDIAYTLQIGRDAMEERLAVIVESKETFENKLAGYLKGDIEPENIFMGQVGKNKDTLVLFEADQEFRETLDKWIQHKKIAKLASLWVKGISIDWEKLYNDPQPGRISLPGYPFARTRYWIPDTDKQIDRVSSLAQDRKIHPLLHQNTSDLSEQRFSSTFFGSEFLFSDHLIK
ncbi:MAG: SDR family NAD(P)-dependent oxidoreductase, partial [Proteobacteria bacterium]|nr:SDR family NAD(P)-dependent oxidoreductase [Pseudomonadota bacterium]